MKRICFVSIFDLTVLYHTLSAQLAERGHEIYWMTTNPKWTDWLSQQGTVRDRILELAFRESEFFTGRARESVLQALSSFESESSRTVSTSMIADQFVMDRPGAMTSEIMLLYFTKIESWLREKEIDLVFAEPTNSNEMLTHMICEKLKIPFLFPQTMRIPSDRFFFSPGIEYGSMITPASHQQRDEIKNFEKQAEELIASYRNRPERPQYFHLNNAGGLIDTTRISKSLPKRMTESFGDQAIHLTHHRTPERVKMTLRKVVNRTRLEKFTEYPSLDSFTGRLAFFGLHVQPEQSIDAVGPFVSDQVKLVKDIRRSLPMDVTLLIKEHPNALGSKPWHEIAEIQRIPGVALIDHRVSTFEIYKRASIVFTVSGTTAFESAMLGTPAVTFTRMYFGGLSSVYCCEDITQLKTLIFSILKNHQPSHEQDIQAVAKMLASSFPGYWTDPLSDQSVMNPANLAQLTEAFVRMVEDDPR